MALSSFIPIGSFIVVLGGMLFFTTKRTALAAVVIAVGLTICLGAMAIVALAVNIEK